jgi:hypothetical protein
MISDSQPPIQTPRKRCILRAAVALSGPGRAGNLAHQPRRAIAGHGSPPH